MHGVRGPSSARTSPLRVILCVALGVCLMWLVVHNLQHHPESAAVSSCTQQGSIGRAACLAIAVHALESDSRESVVVARHAISERARCMLSKTLSAAPAAQTTCALTEAAAAAAARVIRDQPRHQL